MGTIFLICVVVFGLGIGTHHLAHKASTFSGKNVPSVVTTRKSEEDEHVHSHSEVDTFNPNQTFNNYTVTGSNANVMSSFKATDENHI